jgi:hypothetical protein
MGQEFILGGGFHRSQAQKCRMVAMITNAFGFTDSLHRATADSSNPN